MGADPENSSKSTLGLPQETSEEIEYSQKHFKLARTFIKAMNIFRLKALTNKQIGTMEEEINKLFNA